MTKAKILMIQGTSSGVGKSIIVTSLCRIISDLGFRVSPFKAQNMSSNIYKISRFEQISNIQAVQAIAARTNPTWKNNPILLFPLGDYMSNVFLKGKFYERMHASDYYRNFVIKTGFPIVLDTLETLRKENDVIIIEGAGSPAEINIAKYDIANMLLAKRIDTPVILVSDIERGGCFASIVGTMQLLKLTHRQLVKGFLINKFRGDKNLLKDGIDYVEKSCKITCFGVIPKINISLPQEDSLDGNTDNNSKQARECSNEMLDNQIDLLASEIKKNINLDHILERVLRLSR
ncbi:MAG: cobyric acid synthase [Nitrososphaeraceae archaeon]|nr:cobyric acid synthase [Nitrososphaeraceae archaeon]